MAQKCQRNLFLRDSAAIVRHTDVGNASVPDLHSHCSRLGIDGIFQKLLYHRRGTLDHLSGSDFIDGTLIQYSNMWHNASLPAVLQLALQSA